MTDPLRRLQSGERLTSIPAAAWNAFVDAARFVRGMQAGAGVADTSLAVGPGQVLVLNDSGEDRDQFDVLQLSEAVVTPTASAQEFARRIALTGITPADDWAGSFVVLAEPIASGQIGRAWIDGACPARVNGGGGFADTKDGEAGYLQAGDVGSARILWSESGEDERLAYVRLNDPRSFVLVKTVDGPDATAYPVEADNPTVYRCRMLMNPSFPKAAGAGSLTYTETDRYDYVKNLVSDHYIEEGSILGAFPLDGQLYTMDKLVQSEMLVVGHSLGTTAQGTGSLSRLNPATGAVVWTVDLGTTGGVPKIAYGVDLDSRGNVYVVWRQSNDGAGLGSAASGTGQSQGVVKLDKDGNTLATYSLPATNLSFSGPSYVGPHPAVKVDPNDDDAIYVGCDYDTSSKWLYKFDSTLAVMWSIGTAATGFAETSRCSSIALDAAGNLYVGNASIWSVTSSGTVGSNDVTTPFEAGLFVDSSNDKLRLASVESVSSAYAATGWTTFPTSAFSRQRTDFTTPEALGTWDSSRSYDFAGSGGYGDGLRTIFASANSMRYARAGGLGNYYACYLITDPAGVAGTSGTWGDPATAAVIYSLSRDVTSGKVYVAGAGTESSARRIVAQIDPATGGTTWTSQVYSSPLASSSGWAIATRTIQA